MITSGVGRMVGWEDMGILHGGFCIYIRIEVCRDGFSFSLVKVG